MELSTVLRLIDLSDQLAALEQRAEELLQAFEREGPKDTHLAESVHIRREFELAGSALIELAEELNLDGKEVIKMEERKTGKRDAEVVSTKEAMAFVREEARKRRVTNNKPA